MKVIKYTIGSLLSSLAIFSTASAQNIEFWYGNTGKVEKAIQTACEAFNQAQKTHRVKCVGQGGYEPAMQKAIAAYRSKQHPTLIQFFDAGTLDLMLSGAITPIQEALPDVAWNDYITGTRTYYETSKGALMSQPYNGSTLIFYADMKALNAVGVNTLPVTYEQVIEVARKLKGNGHKCPLLQRVHPWITLEQFSARHGEAIASKHNGYEGLNAEYTFQHGLVHKHLENIKAWREEGLMRIPADVAAGKNAFVAKECAMMESSTGMYGAAYSALGDNMKIGLAPNYEGTKRYNTLIGGASIWMMKGHSEEEYSAAKAFLNFLRGDKQQIEFTKATGYMPVTNTALGVLMGSDLADDPQYATAQLGVESLSMPSNANSRGIRLGFYVQFRDIYVEEVSKAFNGEQSIKHALNNSAKRGNALLRRFEQTYKNVQLP